ncbi:NAD-P-binding protein [Vararia minispora EC-137]|uniref:NAD-P-binding protein n=1 Tax=Vararia minispora EC-137 TaxID=1314806 RepID=A0ACB8Q6E9_9AGAM|nr:NAD-P-binding protein [Vararia minispora EC-137]
MRGAAFWHLLGYDHCYYDPSREIPDLTGKVAVVTGVSEETIGHYCVQLLSLHGCKVYAASRNEQKTLHCLSVIEKAHPKLKGSGLLIFHHLDLSSCVLAKRSGEEFRKRETRLDILVNNAGRLALHHSMTPEGIEESIATNHVGMFVFTNEVLPVLKSTSKLPGSDVRVVIHTSLGHTFTVRHNFESPDDLNDLPTTNSFLGRSRRYGTSKFMNLLFTRELQQRLDAEGYPMIVIALHPGVVQSSGAQACNPWFVDLLFRLLGVGPYEGAFTTLFAATSAEVAARRDKYRGAYVLPYGRIAQPAPQAQDDALAKTLWDTTERVVADICARAEG